MREEFQVAVVGAGPAGSTAAEVAALAGAKVVLIDRKSEIGTPIQCGGFLPEVNELKGLMPRARLPLTLMEIPDRCVSHRTSLQRIYPPSGRCKEFPVAARIVDRRAFDRHLAARAARAGARVLPATRARLDSGRLILSGRFSGSILPQVIVGADGPLSGISRSMGNPQSEMGICLEYEMADIEIDATAAEMYFSTRYAPGGYAWIIPTAKDMAFVGVGVRSSYGKSKVTDLLDSFVKEHPQASEKLGGGEVMAVMRGLVPASGSVGTLQKGNLLLAGDAAGHVMATSGGGIPLAMVAGRIAGEVASEHLKGRPALQEYPSRIRDEFGEELERSVRIKKMVEVAMHSDRLMDALLGALGPQQIKAVMRAQIPAAWPKVRDLAEETSAKDS
ncbi:MAG TPA: NAD(P)/FAD-dependent oxidoreductase [Methanothrix sp.]|nr:NAD(P)/FAD-dependent oxidoreductase [Methanothrix sp.]